MFQRKFLRHSFKFYPFIKLNIQKFSLSETSSSTDSTPQDTKNTNEQESSNYPTHFRAGSLIQLSNGSLRPVEDLNTDDFIKSAELSNEVQIDQSVVVSITPSKEKGSVMLGFSVGKDEVQVRILSFIFYNSLFDTIVKFEIWCMIYFVISFFDIF